MPRIRPFIVFGLLAATCLSPSGTIYAETQHGHRHEPLPNVTEYLDRLDRPERDQDQKPAQVIEALQLKPGMDVADLGAGSGYFTRRFVDAVTESGTVYVIDVEPESPEACGAEPRGLAPTLSGRVCIGWARRSEASCRVRRSGVYLQHLSPP